MLVEPTKFMWVMKMKIISLEMDPKHVYVETHGRSFQTNLFGVYLKRQFDKNFTNNVLI